VLAKNSVCFWINSTPVSASNVNSVAPCDTPQHRLLKKSAAFGDESGGVAFEDEEMSDEASGGADRCTTASTGISIVVGAFPGEFRAGGAVAAKTCSQLSLPTNESKR
jgi:hypothetical protein